MRVQKWQVRTGGKSVNLDFCSYLWNHQIFVVFYKMIETYTLHPTPYTLHPTPHTLHPTPYTLSHLFLKTG